MRTKMRRLFAGTKPCLYILRNDVKPRCHKFGQTNPVKSPGQSVAARIHQTNNGKNQLPNARWYPERIIEIASRVGSEELRALEAVTKKNLVARGYKNIGKSDYFYAPADVIAMEMRKAIKAAKLLHLTTRY